MITPRLAQDFMDKYLWILVLVLAVAIFWKEMLRGIRRFVERVRSKGFRQALKRERKPLVMAAAKGAEGKDGGAEQAGDGKEGGHDADKIEG
jgi:hypothetical protein